MYVVGAKNTKEILKIRRMVPNSYLLIPGVGAQGGNMTEICKYGLDKNINIQYYPKNGGYKQYHTERTNLNYPIVSRHLVFMTYLNDITDRGETEFFHQKIKVKPKKGLTLIWPVDWTFTHRGIPSPTQEKYIITGWYNFIPRN